MDTSGAPQPSRTRLVSRILGPLHYQGVDWGHAPPAEEQCSSPLEALPHSVLCATARKLAIERRVALRETCRALAAALAGAFDAVCVRVHAFESGGAAAAASLARAFPAARLAVVKLWLDYTGDSVPPSEASMDLLFTTLASTKPCLEFLDIEWQQRNLPSYQHRLAARLLPGMASAKATFAAPAGRVAAAALARAVFAYGAWPCRPPRSAALAAARTSAGLARRTASRRSGAWPACARWWRASFLTRLPDQA
jgi:hypothetical protein